MNKKVETILQIASLDKKEIEFKYENVSLILLLNMCLKLLKYRLINETGRSILTLKLKNQIYLATMNIFQIL